MFVCTQTTTHTNTHTLTKALAHTHTHSLLGSGSSLSSGAGGSYGRSPSKETDHGQSKCSGLNYTHKMVHKSFLVSSQTDRQTSSYVVCSMY